MKSFILFFFIILSAGTSSALANRSYRAKADSVLICRSSNAYAYHSYECKGLARCTHKIIKVTIEEARKMGYKPCKICYR